MFWNEKKDRINQKGPSASEAQTGSLKYGHSLEDAPLIPALMIIHFKKFNGWIVILANKLVTNL